MTHRGPVQPLPFCDSLIFFFMLLTVLFTCLCHFLTIPLNELFLLAFLFVGSPGGARGDSRGAEKRPRAPCAV